MADTGEQVVMEEEVENFVPSETGGAFEQEQL
jgi:hypothetical protein